MSNDKHYPTHPGAEHPPIMTCEIPLEEYESIKRENERLTIDKRNAELRADVADATVEKLQAKNAELKAENERLNRQLEHVKNGDCIYTCDVVENHVKEELKAKRALWLARAMRASNMYQMFVFSENIGELMNINGFCQGIKGCSNMRKAEEWQNIWQNVASKCRAKAEQYK